MQISTIELLKLISARHINYGVRLDELEIIAKKSLGNAASDRTFNLSQTAMSSLFESYYSFASNAFREAVASKNQELISRVHNENYRKYTVLREICKLYKFRERQQWSISMLED